MLPLSWTILLVRASYIKGCKLSTPLSCVSRTFSFTPSTGSDANDFKNNVLAETAYEDIYMTIRDIDGPEWADKLRARMWGNKQAHKDVLPSEQSLLLTSRMV